MRFFKKILSGVLVLSLLCLYFPKIGFAGQSRLIAKANTATPITKHKPEILSLPEEDIPIEKRGEAVEGKKKTWGWYVLGGAVVIGLIVAAVAAGGGGGGSSGSSDNDNDKGDVTVIWQ
jgi:hypothetical protein